MNEKEISTWLTDLIENKQVRQLPEGCTPEEVTVRLDLPRDADLSRVKARRVRDLAVISALTLSFTNQTDGRLPDERDSGAKVWIGETTMTEPGGGDDGLLMQVKACVVL